MPIILHTRTRMWSETWPGAFPPADPQEASKSVVIWLKPNRLKLVKAGLTLAYVSQVSSLQIRVQMPSRCHCTATEGICKSRQAHLPYEKGHRIGCPNVVNSSTNLICLECRTGGEHDWHTRPSKARRTQLSAEPAVATNAMGEPAVANGLSQTAERDHDETLNCGGTASTAEARHKKDTSWFQSC